MFNSNAHFDIAQYVKFVIWHVRTNLFHKRLEQNSSLISVHCGNITHQKGRILISSYLQIKDMNLSVAQTGRDSINEWHTFPYKESVNVNITINHLVENSFVHQESHFVVKVGHETHKWRRVSWMTATLKSSICNGQARRLHQHPPPAPIVVLLFPEVFMGV